MSARTERRTHRSDEAEGELNIVPYLDILVNLILFLLVTQATLISLGLIDVTAPTQVPPGPGPRTDQQSLKLTIGIADGGFFIAAKGGVLGDEKDQPTIARLSDGAFDYRALTAKLRAIKNAFHDTDAIYVAADDDIPYDVVVKTLDAARADAQGPLFAAVAFAQLE